MRHSNADLIVAVVAAALGLATLLLVPHQIADGSLAAIADMQSPAFFPVFAGALMVGCAAALGVKVALVGGERKRPQRDLSRLTFVLAVGGIFVLFAAGSQLIGMIPSAVAVIIVMGWLWGFRDLRKLVPVGLLVPIAIYLLFEKMLLIILPRGMVFPW